MAVRRAAAVDIGSNTTLFLIGDVDANGMVNPLEEAQVYNGIGADVFTTGGIETETIEKNVEILGKMVDRATAAGAETIILAGTSALRQAVNAELLKQRVKSVLNNEIKIISGEDEADLTYQGFLSGGKITNDEIMLVDIGGGSSELIRADKGRIIFKKSIDTGAVRLSRDYNLGDPPNIDKYREMLSFLQKQLSDLMEIEYKGDLVFSGGTASSLAAMKNDLKIYDGKIVEGTVLKYSWLKETQKLFLQSDLSGRRNLLPFDPERATVIIYGTVIILTLMKLWNKKSVTITNRGLRYGLLSQWGKANKKDKG